MSGKRVLALYGAVLFCFAAVVCRLYWLCSATADGARAAAGGGRGGPHVYGQLYFE